MMEQMPEEDWNDEQDGGQAIVLFVPESGTGKMRLDQWLVSQLPDLSRSRIQALIREGRVLSPGVELHAKDHVEGPREITVAIPPPAPVLPQPQDIPLDVLFEDDNCLVLNKPAGICVHPGPGHVDGTLVNALLFHCKNLAGVGGYERPGIVHRLDRDTSGLLVVAKTDVAMRGLTNLFKTGGIRKEYLCLVHGRPPTAEGTLDTLIGRHPVLRQHWAVVTRNGRRAITHWRVERELGAISLLRVKIDTGRTHQIRVHMASLRCPVIGDAFYGRASADASLTPRPQRQMLHAHRLVFTHPTTGRLLEFVAPPPADFVSYLDPSSSNGKCTVREGA